MKESEFQLEALRKFPGWLLSGDGAYGCMFPCGMTLRLFNRWIDAEMARTAVCGAADCDPARHKSGHILSQPRRQPYIFRNPGDRERD